MPKPQLPAAERVYLDYLASGGRVLADSVLEYEQRAHEAGICPDPALKPDHVRVMGSVGTHVSYNKLLDLVDAGMANVPEEFAKDIANSTAATISFCEVYRDNRHTYEVSRKLSECFEGVPWPSDLPSSALLHLPATAFGMSIENERGDRIDLALWYDFTPEKVSGDPLSTEQCLMIGEASGTRVTPIILLPLGEHSMDESFQRVHDALGLKYAGAALPDGMERGRELVKNRLAPLINVLLYIAGSDDHVKRVGNVRAGKIKKYRRAANVTPELEGALSEDYTEGEVGAQMIAAMRRYADGERSEGASTGRSVRPHMRRAHSRLYWTGEGRTIPRVRFLAPVSVKGGSGVKPTLQPAD